jgi:hypothetical protein
VLVYAVGVTPSRHSFHTLLGDLATLTRNVVRLGRDRFTAILATPTRTQHRALDQNQTDYMTAHATNIRPFHQLQLKNGLSSEN